MTHFIQDGGHHKGLTILILWTLHKCIFLKMLSLKSIKWKSLRYKTYNISFCTSSNSQKQTIVFIYKIIQCFPKLNSKNVICHRILLHLNSEISIRLPVLPGWGSLVGLLYTLSGGQEGLMGNSGSQIETGTPFLKLWWDRHRDICKLPHINSWCVALQQIVQENIYLNHFMYQKVLLFSL